MRVEEVAALSARGHNAPKGAQHLSVPMAEQDVDIALFSDDEVLDLTGDEDWDDIEVALSCGLADLLFPAGVVLC